MTNRCGQCKYYRTVSAGAGWCQRAAMQVAVIADKEACKDFEERTKEVTISLTEYLDIARALVKHLPYNNELELLKVLLEEE
ncbi:hypothetical protein [Candidatus Darwinibacter acetoxidans]